MSRRNDMFLGRDPRSFPMLLDEGNDVRPSSMMIAVYPSREFLRVAEPLASRDQIDNGIHMTLIYLGEKTQQAAIDICKRLRTIAPEIPVMDLDVTGSGAFFTPDALVRVLLMNSPQLPRVRYSLEKMLDELGYLPESRYGHMPHVTLEYHDDFKVPAGWEMQATMPFPKMEVDHIHVVRGNTIMEVIPIGGRPAHLSDLGFRTNES